MWDKEQQEAWDNIENIWNESSQGKEIKIALSQLIIELEHRTSQFEKNVIKRDIKRIKHNTSQFEKDSIKKDIVFIKRNVNRFEQNFIKKGMSFIAIAIKKMVTKLKGKAK